MRPRSRRCWRSSTAREGNDERALAVVERALRHLLPTPNLHYVAGTLALRVERPDEALLHFERCLTYRDQVLVVAIQEGVTSWVALTGIAQAHLLKDDRRTARRLLASALELKPDYEQAALTLSRMQAEDGDFGNALVTLTDLLTRKRGLGAAMQQATLLLARLGEVHHAKALGGRAVELLAARAESDEATRLEQFINSLG
jgi:tetratricopeptide (TPR) repeat protein